MIVHFLFENAYTRILIACILSIVLSFIDKIDMFHKKEMLYFLILFVCFIIFTNTYNDYGLLLLLIALMAMTYVNVKTVR
jgi:hypothetical protein